MKNLTLKIKTTLGFTLVELLLVMAIISVLATLSLVVVSDAQHDAKKSATQTRINLITRLLAEDLEDHAVLRAPSALEDFIDQTNDDWIAVLRETVRRIKMDILNSEMPREFEDLAIGTQFPSAAFRSWYADNNSLFVMVDGRTLVDFLEDEPTFAATTIASSLDAMNHPATIGDDENSNTTSSEYLYMVLQKTESNGVLAIEVLRSSSFANTDNDDFPEVIDSWGNPIGFEFEMYDDDGQLVETGLNSGWGESDDPGSSPNFVYPTAHFGIRPDNIRIRIFSSGNGIEAITN